MVEMRYVAKNVMREWWKKMNNKKDFTSLKKNKKSSFKTKEFNIFFELKKDQWISGKELADKFKCDRIFVRRTIKFFRSKGIPIIASDKGYKLARNKKELMDYVNLRLKEIDTEIATLKAMER